MAPGQQLVLNGMSQHKADLPLFLNYTFILQMYLVMPMKMEVGERNYDLIFHKNYF